MIIYQSKGEKKPVLFDELDWNQFIELQQAKDKMNQSFRKE